MSTLILQAAPFLMILLALSLARGKKEAHPPQVEVWLHNTKEKRK